LRVIALPGDQLLIQLPCEDSGTIRDALFLANAIEFPILKFG